MSDGPAEQFGTIEDSGRSLRMATACVFASCGYFLLHLQSRLFMWRLRQPALPAKQPRLGVMIVLAVAREAHGPSCIFLLWLLW